jgi:hypothetical protein
MSWKVYFPFRLLDHHTIEELPAGGSIGGYHARLELNEPYYVLILSGIDSIDDAKRAFNRLLIAFYWASTEVGLLAEFATEIQKVCYAPDPVQAAKNLSERIGLTYDRIDGIMDGGRPAIIEEKKKISTVTGQLADFKFGHSPKTLLAALDSGFQSFNEDRPLPENILSALAAYKLAHFLAEGTARFMILWSVVEALAPRAQRLPFIEEHVQSLINTTKAEIESTDSIEKKAALQRLLSRIGNLKSQSHTERIRDYVASILEKDNVEDYSEIADLTTELYGRRGSFTHGDSTEIGDGLSQLDAIVRKILKAAIRHACER